LVNTNSMNERARKICCICYRLSSVFVYVGVSSPEKMTVEHAHSALENMFETLRGVSHARDHLKQFSSVYTPSDGTHQVSEPLL